MNPKDDPLGEIRRALGPQREIQRALEGLAGSRSVLQSWQSDTVRDAIAAAASGHQATSALALAARGVILTGQIRSAMEAARTGMLPSSTLAALKISGDLGIGTAAQAALAASRGSLASSFATGGAVAEALKSLKSLSGADGVLAGLLRDSATTASAMKQAQTALGISGAILSLNAATPLPSAETFARATRWSVEQSLVGGTLAEVARNAALGGRSASLLMDGATRTAAESWRTIMDGVMGTSLAGLRPSVVAAYAGMHRSSLPVLANLPGFALPQTDSAVAGHLADQLARMRTDMSDLLSPLGAMLEASRLNDRSFAGLDDDHDLATAGAQLEAAISEVAQTGTLDALLRFIDQALATFIENTRREAGGLGAITLLPLLVALFQIMIWLQPAWTPQPDATLPPGIERVHQEQHALAEKFDDLTTMLARHEADNLGSIPRAQVKRPARVRTGPGTAYPLTWRLEPGEVVGVRDREDGWVLVFYRDPLSGVVGSGWVYSGLLDAR